MTELKNPGVEDVLIAVVDGLKGFPEAITAVFPQRSLIGRPSSPLATSCSRSASATTSRPAPSEIYIQRQISIGFVFPQNLSPLASPLRACLERLQCV